MMMFFMIVLALLNGPALAADIVNSSQPVQISAAKSIEWNRKDKTYTAREKVVAIQGASKIESDTLIARYNEENGATNITTLEADGHVAISLPPYKAFGDHAVYDIKTGEAVLTGKVRILQGENWLEGTRAVVDMKTGISRLFGTGNAEKEEDGRVRGVFYPAPSKP